MQRRASFGLAASIALMAAVPAPVAWAGLDLRAVAPIGIAGSDTAPLAAVGDVDGDGVLDVAVGLQKDLRLPEPASLNEIALVGFARTPPDSTHPDFSGLVLSRLNGRFGGGGGDVVGVGDWDGDGLDDVAFGAAGAGRAGRPNAGAVYVVLGRREPGEIDVRTGAGIVRIDGPARSSEIGRTLGAAGDVDGDGRPDLAIALPGERAVIVRGGSPGGTRIDLLRPPAGGTIELRGLDAGPERNGGLPRENSSEAASFAAAGDVDGDGRGELLIGLPAADPLRGRGRALVVRGAAGGALVDARARGARIARVIATQDHPGLGGSVATVPDTDGDGHSEWVISATAAEGVFGIGELPNGAFVALSSARGDIRPSEAGQPVVTVDLRGRGSNAGRSVAGVPDATGDGVPDLLVGLPEASPSCRAGAGAIALVAGRRTPGAVRLGARSPRIDGPRPGAGIGSSIAASRGEAFLGATPYERSARLNLWRVPLTALAAPSPALPAPRDCLSVAVTKRSREQLVRGAALRVALRSDAGDGQPHRLRVGVEVVDRRTAVPGPRRVIALPGAGRRRLTLRLPRRAAKLLERGTLAAVVVTAEQRVGPGSRSTAGAGSSASIMLRAERP